MIFDREHECMRRPDLRRLQEERLKALVKRVHNQVPFYRTCLIRAASGQRRYAAWRTFPACLLPTNTTCVMSILSVSSPPR